MREIVKDAPTVTGDGTSLQPLIDGVVVRYQPPIQDERGEIVEIYSPTWNVMPSPVVYTYLASVRPGLVKGWIVHYEQDDRLFVVLGRLRIGLYDARSGSPTHGRLNVFTVSDRRRALVVIPRGVFHGVQNVGEHEAFYVNMPTRAYSHDNPDKFRLPVKNDLIPFAFEVGPGR